MRKLHTFLVISFLIVSTLYSPFLFSTIVLSQEGTSGSGSTTSGTSGSTPTTSGSSTPPPTTTTTQTTTTQTQPAQTTTTTQTQPTTEPPKTETKPPETTTTTPTATPATTTPTIPPPKPPEEIKPVQACPAPPQSRVCDENQGVVPKFDDKGCVTGYDCKEIQKTEVGQVAVCPEIPPPRLTCQPNERLNKLIDDKGCVTGYNCVSSGPEQIEVSQQTCPTPPKKQSCDGSLSPIFDKGCLIGYTCVPEGCRQETDSSGFVRVVCKQERVCQADQQQKELVDNCKLQGGNPVPFQDPSGCTFYDCRFDEREIHTNPIGGYQSCPSPEEIHQESTLCKEAGLNPRISFEGGCKIVKCSQEEGFQEREDVCRFVAESEKLRIENECSAAGLSVVRDINRNGCAFYRCEGPVGTQTCQRDIPPEAYKKCDSIGGEMVVKNDRNGCIAFSQCVEQGDENDAYVDPVEEVPDATVLLNLALKLEKLKIELEKLATEAKEISEYYASTGSLDEERYNRVSSMFDAAANRIDEIKLKIRDNVDELSTDDLDEIRHDIKYIKEVTLKDILYLMLSNSDDVKETLELSKKVSVKELDAEKLSANTKNCGTDGGCFDRAIRSCKPVSFQPEGRNGPSLTIKGLEDENCVVHVIMQSEDMVPPGYTQDEFYMECPIPNYALGVRGPEDFIPHCEGPMAQFAKQFGGGAQISGGSNDFQEILEREGGPGGCESEKECATYCLDNYDECKQWVKEHPAVGPIPSREELRSYASGEFEKEFSGGARGPSGQRFAGPGGCTGPQECERFCRSNPDECLRFCDENPGICPQSKGEISESRGFGQQPQEFRQPRQVQAGPASRAPEGVQACVGCLNNGVCDIGECSECGDCLRGERTITGEITRVR